MDNAEFFDRLRQPSPLAVGTRIALVAMPSDPDPLPPGTQGTVTGGNGAQVYVDWDGGRSLILLPGVDRWRVIP